MKVVIYDEANPTPQVFERAEAVLVLGRENGELMLNSVAPGRFILGYFPPLKSNPKSSSYHEVFSGGLFTRQEAEAVSWGINRLAMRFPGPETPKDVKHTIEHGR